MLLCFLKDVKDCLNDPNFVYNAVSRRKQSGAGDCIQDTLSSRARLAFRPSASREQRYLAYNAGEYY